LEDQVVNLETDVEEDAHMELILVVTHQHYQQQQILVI
jgi:hypothetical protein